MNLFITIMCLTLLATASADVGYNYNQPKPIARQNVRSQATAGNSGIYSIQQAPPLTTFNVQSQPQVQTIKQNFIAPPLQPVPALAPAPAPIPQYTPPRQYVQQQQFIAPQPAVQIPQYVSNVQQPAAYAPLSAAATSQSTQIQYNPQPQQQTIISKDIYIHSAPEDTDEININQEEEFIPARKNYRIVFIKAPSQNIRFNVESLKRTQAANEEKTVIYVLSKKPDITNINTQLTAIQKELKTNKPEVYFIKYKTQEEANRAQQEIQAQYDALGGSTTVSDEGFAPITSVIGSSNVNVAATGGSANGFSNNFLQAPSNNRPQFVQSSLQGSQASSSNVNFAVQTPGTKYLPVKKK